MTALMNFLKNNQVLLTTLGLGGAGIFGYWAKDLPRKIYTSIKNLVTVNLVFTSQHRIFYELLLWIKETYPNKKFHNLKITNGLDGWNDNAVLSVGYGLHYIKYKGKFLLLTYTKDQGNQSAKDKEQITLTKFGRNYNIFREIIDDISLMKQNKNDKIRVYRMEKEDWRYAKDIEKRPMKSIFLEKQKKNLLIDVLKKFINKEQWYIDNGIPYQLGILLYGPPGTGKTSIIKALAAYLNYNLYYLLASDLAYIENASVNLPEKSIMVIEDIDSNSVSHKRKSENDVKKSLDDSLMDEFSKISLSEILNSIDGVFSTHGRILIATTNHIENLDDALIRPGRIDVKLEIGYVNNEILKDFIVNFFPESKYIKDIDNLKIKNNITVAQLQNLVLLEKSDKEIIYLCKEM